MKEKLHITKKNLNIFYKNNILNEIIQNTKDNCMYRLYKDSNLYIHFQVNPETDEEQYFDLASKKNSMSYPYITQMNKQINVISYKKTICNKKYIEYMLNINDFLIKNYQKNKFSFSFKEFLIRYTLTNNEKLHLNFEDGRNIFSIEDNNGKNFTFVNRDFNLEKIKQNIETFNKMHSDKYVDYDKEALIFNTDSSFVYNCFSNALHPDNFKVYKNKLKDISDKITLYTSLHPEDKKHKNHEIVPFYDWEGNFNNNYKTSLIIEGELIKPYSDRKFAQKYEIENTACSYGKKEQFPKLKLLGTTLKLSKNLLKDLSIKNPIFVNEFTITEDNGNIKIDIQKSYKYKDNELYFVKPFTIIDSIDQLFGARFIDAIDDNLLNSDLCGSVIINGK